MWSGASCRIGEAAVAVADQDGEAVRGLIDDHDIVAAVPGEVARDQADRSARTSSRPDLPAVVIRPYEARARAESERLREGVRSDR